MKKVGKLVRDNIPKIIKDSGRKPIIRNLDDDEYVDAIVEKLHEEIKELQNANTASDVLEEIADIAQVITNMMDAIPAVYDKVLEKAKEKGEFNHKIYLEGIEDEESE